MTHNRRRFLGGALAASTSLVMVSVASAASEVESPTKNVAEAATLPSPNAAAHELALRMRRFDPTLTDKQIGEIAKSIGGSWKAGAKLHKGLSNGDLPSPEFEIGE
jgi:galactokinase/mevalonate kinase-like predicted kinase